MNFTWTTVVTFNLEGGPKNTGDAAKNHVDKYRIKAEMFTFLLILSVFTNISYTLVILNVICANCNTFPLHLQENGKSSLERFQVKRTEN